MLLQWAGTRLEILSRVGVSRPIARRINRILLTHPYMCFPRMIRRKTAHDEIRPSVLQTQ